MSGKSKALALAVSISPGLAAEVVSEAGTMLHKHGAHQEATGPEPAPAPESDWSDPDAPINAASGEPGGKGGFEIGDKITLPAAFLITQDGHALVTEKGENLVTEPSTFKVTAI